MATNFQNRFDPAIKRAGRFDLLLCMGPPKRQSKVDNLALFLNREYSPDELERAATLLESYLDADSHLAHVFDLFTFGDTKALFGQLDTGKSLFDVLKKLRVSGFKGRVLSENEFNLLRIKDLEFLPKELWGKTPKDLERDQRVNFEHLKPYLKFPIIRYLVDKRQSKIQG